MRLCHVLPSAGPGGRGTQRPAFRAWGLSLLLCRHRSLPTPLPSHAIPSLRWDFEAVALGGLLLKKEENKQPAQNNWKTPKQTKAHFKAPQALPQTSHISDFPRRGPTWPLWDSFGVLGTCNNHQWAPTFACLSRLAALPAEQVASELAWPLAAF